ALDGGEEVGFFIFDDRRHLVGVAAELGEGIAHLLRYHGDEAIKERLAEVHHLVAKSHGAADDTADDGVSFLVSWPSAISDGEGTHSRVIGDDAKGDVDGIVEVAAVFLLR